MNVTSKLVFTSAYVFVKIIFCYKYYIQQTLDNLINNSINYSSERIVTITLKQTGKKIEFPIKDEGIGIPM